MIDVDKQLEKLILSAMEEDIGTGDYSTLSTIAPDAMGKAQLKIKEDGILAGLEVAEKIFSLLEPSSKLNVLMKDGDTMRYGDIAFTVEAHVYTILSAERLVLNCMQRMSGIATLTHQYADLLKGYHTKILDTRKTTPNFRLLEKMAVKIGGGVNHRFGLYDMIMLKDNHIDFCGGIEKAIEKAYNYIQNMQLSLAIEVETRSLEDVQKVINCGKGKVKRIMLDSNREAQQHARQAKLPTVSLVSCRQTQPLALSAIQPPANTAAFDPAMQQRQIGYSDTKASAHGRHVQQIHDLANGPTAGG
jgi:nicotinate-nucleotide pyrophosphorylase (carboxylating)